MTPTQLTHLRAIDSHLTALLDLAAKRTPGEWAGEYELVAQIIPNKTEFGVLICEGKSYPDMDFIAACAGRAEAGWRATKAAIAYLPEQTTQWGELSLEKQLIESILSAWPLELLKL